MKKDISAKPFQVIGKEPRTVMSGIKSLFEERYLSEALCIGSGALTRPLPLAVLYLFACVVLIVIVIFIDFIAGRIVVVIV